MAIVRKVKNGWIVVNEATNEPLIQRVFNSKALAQQFAAQYSGGFHY